MIRRLRIHPFALFIAALTVLLSIGGARLALGAIVEEGELMPVLGKTTPVYLIENVGQYDEGALFAIRHGAGTTWLAEDAIWLTLYQEPGWTIDAELGDGLADDALLHGVNIKITFPAAADTISLKAGSPQGAKISYLVGESAAWRPDVPVWAEARYSGLIPGADLLLSGSGGTGSDSVLPWSTELNDQNSIGEVQFRVQGADSIQAQDGQLVLTTANGTFTIPRLMISAGEELGAGSQAADYGETAITRQGKADFLVTMSPGVASEGKLLSPEDDPNDLIFSTYLGGSASDAAYGVDVDPSGYPYVIGRTPSADFPTTPGAFDQSLSVIDVFVTKLEIDGTDLVYSTFIGGSSYERGYAIAVEDGYAYITGDTQSTDFPGQDDNFGDSDAFVVKLNTTGSDILYSTLIGGNGQDTGYGIDVEAGIAFITGETWSNNFPGHEGESDAFVARLNPSGGVANLLALGGNFEDGGAGIAVNAGSSYVTGYADSPNFPGTGYSGGRDVFVVKLDSSFSVDYSVLIGGSGTDRGRAIAVDSAGRAYATGYTNSADFPVTEGSLSGDADAYLVRLDNSGAITYGTLVGGANFDEGKGLDIDWLGGIDITGYTTSADFPTTVDAFDTSHNGAQDGFVTRFDLSAGAPVSITYSSYFGGSAEDTGYALKMDDLGIASMVGGTSSTDYPVTPGTFDETLDGSSDAFVTQIQVIQLPDIDIEKSVNDHDADDPPGPYLTAGVPITWEYSVTNRGDFILNNVNVSDDMLGPICGPSSIDPRDTLICSAYGQAEPGQYVNVGTATGYPEGGGDPVSDIDTSHYFGAEPLVEIDKLTAGFDADAPPGPLLRTGEIVTWTYGVTNTGNVILDSVVITDSLEGTADCPFDTLLTGQTMTCVLTGTVVAGQYDNTGEVRGIPPGGLDPITSSDPSHYFGIDPSLAITKYTNGEDAAEMPGPTIRVGDPVDWTYVITNTGNYTVSQVTVSDDQGVEVSCPFDFLVPDESMTCSGSGIAQTGQYTNTGTVTATVPVGPVVVAEDVSHYYGADPQVVLQKYTNDQDADSAPGPFVVAGDPVTWTYVVTNTGNVPLYVEVADDQLGLICTISSLNPGDPPVYCTVFGTAVSGQYANTGIVTGTAPVGPDIYASDPSHYFGSDPAVEINKLTNGNDADNPPGPHLAVGDIVTWTYLITNSGNVPLTEVTVTDDHGLTVSCPGSELAVNTSMVCSATGTVSSGQYTNIGSVEAAPPVGDVVTNSDLSHYYGSSPSIALEKRTEGQDADIAPGPIVLAGESVSWTYLVTNTGDVPLSDILVTDDQGVAVNCPQTGLDVSESMVCDGTGVAIPGQYTNTAVVEGKPPDELPVVTAGDVSHYYGAAPELTIEKATRGEDADLPPGPFIVAGDSLTWTYNVTNTGNITLTNVTVSDDVQESVVCIATYLAPDNAFSCTMMGVAAAGQYTNTGIVTGTAPVGPDVSAQDSSHYYGVQPQVTLEKLTMGQDADSPPGPYVETGDLVIWTYLITNTGDIKLINIEVTDSRGVPVSCPKDQLEVGESMACSASGTALSGQYDNLGLVVANPLDNTNIITDSDASHYFGADLVITLEKLTNGDDADSGPGPLVLEGDSVDWTYQVTNGSNVTLTGILVTDDQGVVVDCPQTTLATAEGMTCTAGGIAVAGQYMNTGTVSGIPPGNLPAIQDSDPSHYFGVAPGINLEKQTNGQDADLSPGPYIVEGDAVDWEYLVTNTGNYTLTGVIVFDDVQGAVSCPKSELAAGEQMTCSSTGIAGAGQYTNLGSASGSPPVGSDVTDEDLSHYFGITPEITIEKLTNGQDADTAPGPTIFVGHPVTWTYVISNVGNISLTGIIVEDDQGLIVSCPYSALAAGEGMSCSAGGLAAPGQYANLGSVTASPPVGPDVGDSDPSHYFGFTIEPSIDIQKSTNGQDADNPPGPYVPLGQPITWEFSVANSGNITLTDVQVTDSHLGSITCPKSALVVAESMVCTAFGSAASGQYSNLGSVSALDFTGAQVVTDTDSSHYYGSEPGISLEKYTNGEDADDLPGPYLEVGDTVTWTYVVSNTGNVPLSGIAVTDDQGLTVICPQDALDLGEGMTCSATGVASEGQYTNMATVSGTPPVGADVIDQDISHYFGANLVLGMEKSTNGFDADLPPGPLVPVGQPLAWTYVVTNGSNVQLTGVDVVDDMSVLVTCPKTTLDPGETMTCSAAGTASAGQYANIGTATGTPPGGLPQLEVTDPSHYYGSDPAISLEKWTNGLDADHPTGPFIEVDDPVLWEYIVENTGNVQLTGIVVADDQGVTVSCPGTSLDAGSSMTCTASSTAAPGQYVNTGTATGTPPVGVDVSDEDDSHYYGSDPGITMNKYTNGEDADTPPGPTILATLPVTWTYVVTNTGNVTLTNVIVGDDDPGVIPSCSQSELPPGASMTCEAQGTAEAGQYANLGTVSGQPPVGSAVTAEDPSHYYSFIAQPALSLEKRTNGERADQTPGPFIAVGDPVTWTYEVNNPGNVIISNIVVEDSDSSLIINCPQGTLDPGQSMTCTANGTADPGQYSNLGSVSGEPPIGSDVSDDDPSHYYGSDPAIVIKKFTNGSDANAAPGPIVLIGDPVIWTYVVSNTGNVTLTGILVQDDQGVTVSCPYTLLGPEDSMTCSASGVSVPGQYENTGSVSGMPPVGSAVEHSDISHYFGSDPGIELQKLTNGEDADDPPGPFILVGQSVNWSYVVTNTGNITLNNVMVSDDQGVTVDCPQTSLGPGESMTCTGSDTASAGPYTNISYVDTSESVEASDPSHYTGYSLDPAIDVKKYTNGFDANFIPGPMIPVGMTVTWEYLVTNAGSDTLLNIEVEDDQLGTISCPSSTLLSGDSMVCVETGLASAGQYTNYGTVSAVGLTSAEVVSDTDISHYFGSMPGISIRKLTNAEDANQAPGPYMEVGSGVTWTYLITNTGNVILSSIVVTDDQGVTIDCPGDSLNPGQPMTCSATGSAVPGQYTNTGYVSAHSPIGESVGDNDISHYFGAELGLIIEKSTNGQDADQVPGPSILAGQPVTWTYHVTNTSNVLLTNVAVVDDQGVTVDCPKSTLTSGEAMTCMATDTAAAGQYANVGTVTGIPPYPLGHVENDDSSHYFGVAPAVSIEKLTNGQDADAPPGPYIEVGQTISWTYLISNSGNVSLTNILVDDDQGLTVSCPTGVLGAGEGMVCTATGAAVAGQYTNTGTVTGTPGLGPDVEDSDDSHYFGSLPAITIEKHTNGEDADMAPGPTVVEGDMVTWEYVITNPGNVRLVNILVVDDQGLSVSCPQTELDPGESMTCTASGLAEAGQYSNLGTVTAEPPVGSAVEASDPSHYFGEEGTYFILLPALYGG